MPQITIGKGLAFYEEAQALPGVKRVAGMVKQDIELVTGILPAGITAGQGSGCAVLYGTIGHSPMLDALEARGWQWGIVTNKFACFTDPLVEKAGFTGRAAAIISGDATAHLKPSPDNLFVALETIGTSAETCIYVGDDIRDAKAARAAGMDFIAVDWGYIRHDTPIQTWGANYIAHQPSDIIDLLPELEGRLTK